jgi:hypothetical protein
MVVYATDESHGSRRRSVGKKSRVTFSHPCTFNMHRRLPASVGLSVALSNPGCNGAAAKQGALGGAMVAHQASLGLAHAARFSRVSSPTLECTARLLPSDAQVGLVTREQQPRLLHAMCMTPAPVAPLPPTPLRRALHRFRLSSQGILARAVEHPYRPCGPAVRSVGV